MSTSEILSKFSLRFNDPDLRKIYVREKAEYYARALPVVTLMVLVLTVTLEVMYRGMEMGELPGIITGLNIAAFLILGLITFLQKQLSFLN